MHKKVIVCEYCGRILVDQEIDDIVNSFPNIVSVIPKIGQKVREQIQNKLRRQLADKSLKIVDKPEAIEKLKEVIAQQHYNSLIPAGEPVGIRAAEAIGQPVTQMALNSFHSAGSKATVSTGIQAIRELYDMSVERKNESTNIHFKNKYLTFENVMDLRREIVGIKVHELLKPNGKEYMKYDSEDKASIPSWYSLYTDINNSKYNAIPSNAVDFIRLNFNKTKLYSYNVTTEEIANILEQDGIVCIPSPTFVGIVDVFPDPDIVYEQVKKNVDEQVRSGLTQENAPILFLQIIFEPSLKEKVVHGIEGITKLLPDDRNTTWLIVKDDNEQVNPNNPRLWKIVIDKIKQLEFQ
jgi:DNA-directed RNA polymerase beta' subunit